MRKKEAARSKMRPCADFTILEKRMISTGHSIKVKHSLTTLGKWQCKFSASHQGACDYSILDPLSIILPAPVQVTTFTSNHRYHNRLAIKPGLSVKFSNHRKAPASTFGTT